MQPDLTSRPDSYFDTVDLEAWFNTFPGSIEWYEVQSTESDASITIRGERPDGLEAKCLCRLKKAQAGWKVEQILPQ